MTLRPGDVPSLPVWCPTCGLHLTFIGPCLVCLDKAKKRDAEYWTEGTR